jgi:CCR4-NOT transcription complex subunit 7/8
MGAFQGKSDYHYQTLRCNVDMLKMIQLGITFFSEDGEPPPATSDSGIDMHGPRRALVQHPCTWQFNFKFSLNEDMYSQASIDALIAAGVNFQGLERDGIDVFEFGALLISSGLVGDEEIRWISFHGGYDFGYLTKALLRTPLPDAEKEFNMLMKKYFPSIYDIKYILKYAIKQTTMGQLTPDAGSQEILQKFEQKSGLESLADSLKIKRHGQAHQAGSDSLLTGKTFFKIRERIFNGEIDDVHIGKVWGLGFPDHFNPPHGTPQHHHQQLQENTTPNHNGNAYSNGTPSTPNNGHAGLASTPGYSGGIVNPMTPGGGFSNGMGNFQYAK